MSFRSPYCSYTQSNQEFASANYNRQSDRFPLPKCYSDNIYDKYGNENDYRFDSNRYNTRRARSTQKSQRFRGGQEHQQNECSHERQQNVFNRADDDDCFCNVGQDYGQDRAYRENTCRQPNEKDFCDNNQNRSRPYRNSCRQHDDDVCDIYRKPDFCSKYNKSKSSKRKTHGIPKCRMDYGDTSSPGTCCSCKPCPFCLLRSFCAEVLRELAEIKAKQYEGELEKLIYDPKAYQAQVAADKKERASQASTESQKRRGAEGEEGESGEFRRKSQLSREEFSTESARKRHRRSDDGYSRDDNRSRRKRHSEDSITKSRRGKGRDRSFDDRDGKRGQKSKKSTPDGGGDGKNKEKGKQKTKTETQPTEKEHVTAEDASKGVAKEHGVAKKKSEKEQKKKEEDRAKKALIEQRMIQSALLAAKRRCELPVRKYSGPGRFAEVTTSDFMKCRLESIIQRESTIERAQITPPQTPPCLKLCGPVSMPVICSINPKYCCPSFWCPPSACPAICC